MHEEGEGRMEGGGRACQDFGGVNIAGKSKMKEIL